MKRRKFIVTTALLAAVAIAPTACKKKDDGGGGGGGATGASANMLSMMPKDSKVVMGIAWSKARSSGLYKKMNSEFEKGLPPEVAKIKSDCGIDLIADMDTIVLAGDPAAPGDEDKMVIGIKGKIAQKQVEDCIVKMGGKAENGAYTVEGEVINAYWSSPDTVIMSPGLTADAIKALGSGNSVKDNANLMGLIGKVNTSATVWAVGDIPAEAGGAMGSIGAKAPKSGFMSLTMTSGVKAKIGLVFESSKDADSTKSAISGILGMAKGQPGAEFLGSVKAKTDGNAVILSGKISGDQIEALKKMTGGGMPF